MYTKATDNWTLVTGYFDLTKQPDATKEIKERNVEYYLDRYAHSTLGVEQKLVVYCEPQHAERILAIRAHRLPLYSNRTKIVACEFNQFPMFRYRSKIIENRGGVSACARDKRNTASHYLMGMAKYAMMKNAIETDEWNSTHFAWMDLGLEKMGANNFVHLNEALSQNRTRFSSCWIDYVAKDEVQNLSRYYGQGGCKNGCINRCGMASGFFTGDTWHMLSICNRIEEEFIRLTATGYGHGDEQVMLSVYHKNPELFDWFLGDYQEIITNYVHVYDRPEQPMNNLIAHAMEANDLPVASNAAHILLRSHELGTCHLNDDQVKTLCRILGNDPNFHNQLVVPQVHHQEENR